IVDSNNKMLINVQSLDGLGKVGSNVDPGNSYTIERFDGTEALTISMPIIWPTGEVVTMRMTQLLTDIEENMKLLKYVLIGVTTFAMIPITISSMTLGRIVTRPIENLITAMKISRQSGTYEKLTGVVNGNDELAQMERTFNEMMEQLEQNFMKQEQFVSNASHELKTPLTVIESYASLLKRRGMEQPELFHESVDAIHSEAIRMRELTEQLLNLARNDQQWSLNKEDTSLADLVKDSVRSFTNAFNREIELTIDHNPVIHTDGQ